MVHIFNSVLETVMQEELGCRADYCMFRGLFPCLPLSEDRQFAEGQPFAKGSWCVTLPRRHLNHRCLGTACLSLLLCCSKRQRVIMGAGQNPCQVVLPCALRLAGMEEMFDLKFFHLLCLSWPTGPVALPAFERAEMMQQSHGPAQFPQERLSSVHNPWWKCNFPVLNSTVIKIMIEDCTESFWCSFLKCTDLYHSPCILLGWCKSQFCGGLTIKEYYESIWYFVLTIALLRLLNLDCWT